MPEWVGVAREQVRDQMAGACGVELAAEHGDDVFPVRVEPLALGGDGKIVVSGHGGQVAGDEILGEGPVQEQVPGAAALCRVTIRDKDSGVG